MSYDTVIAPAAGTVLPVDTIGTTKFPREKVAFGSEGFATDVSDAFPLPVGGTTLLAALALVAPSTNAFSITPNDSSALSIIPRAIVAQATGNITLRTSGSGSDVVVSAIAGIPLPLRVQYVRATGTTATGIVGFA